VLKPFRRQQGWGQRLPASVEWQSAISHTLLFSLCITLCGTFHIFVFTLLLLLTCFIYYHFTQQPQKTENGKSCPTFFQLILRKKKKKGNKKSSGLSLTFGNPDILCTKVSDIKADCFHAYISNIICFTSAYAQAS